MMAEQHMIATDGPQLTLAPQRASYSAGDTLSGTFTLGALDLAEIKSVELSVLWYTEGKGDEDMAVHYFVRLDPGSDEWQRLGRPQPFSTRLPNSPLSYEGLIVKIRWCVRLRVFMRRGRDVTEELVFRLGEVPAAGAAP